MNPEDSRISHYKKKADWHKKNTPLMADLFKNQCQECSDSADAKSGVIHHNQYTGHDYEKTIEKLLSHNAIKWLCKTCHKIEHIAISRDQVNIRIKHSGFCALCNRFAWHAWFKVELGHKKQYGHYNFPICNGCLKFLLNEGILSEYTLRGEDWSRNLIAWGNLKSLSKGQELLYKSLRNKIDKDSFGSIDWLSKNESSQGKLF